MFPGTMVFPLPEHLLVPHGPLPRRQKSIQPLLGQFFHCGPAGFVDFAHGHHDPFIQMADQFSQGEFRGPQPVQLLFHSSFKFFICLEGRRITCVQTHLTIEDIAVTIV